MSKSDSNALNALISVMPNAFKEGLNMPFGILAESRSQLKEAIDIVKKAAGSGSVEITHNDYNNKRTAGDAWSCVIKAMPGDIENILGRRHHRDPHRAHDYYTIET